MIETMDEHGPPLSDEEITRAEWKLNVRFPLEYRIFLKKHNGGRPTPDSFPYGTDFSILQVFYTIDDGPSNLFEQVEELREYSHIPPEYLPVGNDDFGNLICLMLKGSDRGRVYFWDLDAYAACDDEATIVELAPNFDAFLATLFA